MAQSHSHSLLPRVRESVKGGAEAGGLIPPASTIFLKALRPQSIAVMLRSRKAGSLVQVQVRAPIGFALLAHSAEHSLGMGEAGGSRPPESTARR